MAFIEALVIPSAHGEARFGDVMDDFQRERFGPLLDAMLSVARGEKPAIGRHCWEGTKGCSKDSDLACALVWLLLFTERPLACQIGAADQGQASELRRAASLILRLNPSLESAVTVHAWKIVCTATGSEAEIITCDVAGSHGARPDVLILNELHAIGKWEFALNLLDNSSKVPGGLVVLATNAGFIGSEAHKLCNLARESPRWFHHAYSMPAPWIDAAELAEARRRNPGERFNRLWYGVWSHGTGDALTVADVEAACQLVGPHPRNLPGLVYLLSLDLGLRNDRTALSVLGADAEHEVVHVAHFQDWSPARHGGEIDLATVERAVLEALARYDAEAVVADPWQAVFMVQRLRRQGIRVIEWPFTARNQNLMATRLLEVFRNRTIAMYRDELLIGELMKLSIIERPAGFRLEAPRDKSGHCDVAMSVAMGLPVACQWIVEIQQEWGMAALYAEEPLVTP